MGTLGAFAMWGGFALMLIGGITFIVVAFRESVLWGLGVLFVPFVSLIFLVLNWSRAKDSFFLQLYGVGLVILATVVLRAHLPITYP